MHSATSQIYNMPFRLEVTALFIVKVDKKILMYFPFDKT